MMRKGVKSVLQETYVKHFIALCRYIILAGLALSLTTGILSAENTAEPLPLDAHLKKKYTDDLSGLMKRHYIRVLTTFNKTNYFVSKGRMYGFEYALLKDYEKFLNKGKNRRGLKVVFEFIPVSRDRLIPSLVSGLGDIAAAGLTITPERLMKVDFTDPYLTKVDEVVVADKSVGDLKTLEDLSGRSVFVRQSSSYYESLLSLNDSLSQKGFEPVRIIKADENLETEDILELVNSGAAGITVSDSHIAGIWTRVFENLKVLEHLKLRTGGKIAWMVRKDNPELKASLNEFIKTHRKGTLLGNIYFNRYFKKTKFIKNPLTRKEWRKQNLYKGLFRKYAKKYGFDWMLIMALAYQESGLDNDKKNPSGAVGIMQVLPSMAADKNIGIKKVRLLENNIHASVKYLAFLRDRYFSDKDMRPRDCVRFTLAAYNAGPARIRKVRRLAGKMGFDPNRWFRNVEYAALKLIGRETVEYVSNINKYYIAFRLAHENVKLRSSEKRKIKED